MDARDGQVIGAGTLDRDKAAYTGLTSRVLRDLERDWRRWSVAERISATCLLAGCLAFPPVLLLAAGIHTAL